MDKVASTPPTELAGSPVAKVEKFAQGSKFFTNNDDRVIVRPSGTEPKLKCYLESPTPIASMLLRPTCAPTLEFKPLPAPRSLMVLLRLLRANEGCGLVGLLPPGPLPQYQLSIPVGQKNEYRRYKDERAENDTYGCKEPYF